MEVGGAFVKLGLELSDFEQGLKKAQDTFSKATDAFNKEIDAKAFKTLGLTASSELEKIAKDAKIAFAVISTSSNVTAKDVENAFQKMKAAQDAFAKSVAPVTVFDQIEAKLPALQKFGTELQDVGKLMSAGLTVPLVGLGVALLKVGTDFDNVSDTIRARTGKMGADLEALNTTFRNVFAQVPNSLESVTDAITGLAQRTGATGAELEKLSIQILNMARLTGSEVAPLVQTVTRLFGDWSIATKDQSKSLDFLFKTFQTTGISVQKLSDLVVQFGAPLRAMGFSFEQAAAMLGKFEKEGVNIGTVLSGMRMELGKLAKAGIDPVAGFSALIDKIKNAKTETEATSVAFKVFGQRAAIDMSRAIREGRFELDAFVSTLQNSGESINKAAAETLSFADKFKIFQHQLELSLEPLGKSLVSALEKAVIAAQPLIDKVKDLADWFTKLSPAAQEATFGVAAGLAALGPAVFILGTLVTNIEAVVKAAKMLSAAEGIFASFTKVILAAGVAWATWEITTWATRNIPAVQRFGEALTDLTFGPLTELLRLIPAVDNAFSNFGKKLGFGTQVVEADVSKLEAALARNGVTISKAGLSAEEYAKKLLEAAKGIKAATAAEQSAEETKKRAVKLAADQAAALKKLTEGRDRDAEKAEKAAEREEKAIKKQVEGLQLLISGLPKDFSAFQTAVETGGFHATAALNDMGKKLREIQVKFGDDLPPAIQFYSATLKANIRQIEEWNRAFKFNQLAEEANHLLEKIQGLGDISKIKLPQGLDVFENIKIEVAHPGEVIDTFRALGTSVDLSLIKTQQLNNAFRDLGFTGKKSFEEIRATAQNAFQVMQEAFNRGDLGPNQLEAAWVAMQEKIVAAARAANQQIEDVELLSLQARKAMLQAHTLDIVEAYKVLGITSSQTILEQLDLATAAMDKISSSATATATDKNKALLAVLEAQAKAQIDSGLALNDIQKQQMEELHRIITQGHETAAVKWKNFSSQVGDITRGMVDDIGMMVLTGRGSITEIFTNAWHSIAQSMVKNFIDPVAKILGNFVKNELAAVIGGQGFGGIKKAAEDAGKAISSIFGGAKAASDVAGTAGKSASQGASQVGQVGGMAGTITAVSGVVSAITGVLQFLQGRRMEQDIGRIEVTTRGILNEALNLRKDEWDRHAEYAKWKDTLVTAIYEFKDLNALFLNDIRSLLEAVVKDGVKVEGSIPTSEDPGTKKQSLADLTADLKKSFETSVPVITESAEQFSSALSSSSSETVNTMQDFGRTMTEVGSDVQETFTQASQAGGSMVESFQAVQEKVDAVAQAVSSAALGQMTSSVGFQADQSAQQYQSRMNAWLDYAGLRNQSVDSAGGSFFPLSDPNMGQVFQQSYSPLNSAVQPLDYTNYNPPAQQGMGFQVTIIAPDADAQKMADKFVDRLRQKGIDIT